MCQFISAVVMQSGEILCNPQVMDSHEDLLRAANVRDGIAQQERFVRIEFLPPKDHTRIFDTSSWRLKIDQEDTPSWFDKARVRSSMVARVVEMFVREDRDLLSKGCWILMDGVTVKTVKDARVYAMLGTSRILEMRGTPKVGVMYDSSRVGAMYNSSEIGEMFNSSKVGRMCGSSKVDKMYGSSKVGTMYDSSKVGGLYDSSKVGAMYNLSRVEYRQDKEVSTV